MLRSLILQLSTQNAESAQMLEHLYESSEKGQKRAQNDNLLDLLKSMIGVFGATYIVLDALDECMSRAKLLTIIRKMTAWHLDGLHILFTSRLEADIRETLDALVLEDKVIDIQSSLIESDIRTFIRSRLSGDTMIKSLAFGKESLISRK